MDASIKTTLFLRDTPEVQMLAELLQLEFPTGRFVVGRVGGACSLLFDLEDHISPRQKNLLIDILRTLDSLLVETVYVRGRLGDEILKGYMGPERHSKEKSRKRSKARSSSCCPNTASPSVRCSKSIDLFPIGLV